MKSLLLKRTDSFSTEIVLPPSKSVANRALLLSSLAQGKTILKNVPAADDVKLLREALASLGVSVRESAPDTLEIEGEGGPFRTKGASLFLGNAGSALRPLTALLCCGEGEFRVDGDEQMRKRPLDELLEALRQLGADIQCETGTPPVGILASGLRGGELSLSGKVSSQFVTALLLAAPFCKEDLVLRLPPTPVSGPYIDMTLEMLRLFGVETEREGYSCLRVARTPPRSPGELEVEGDASGASYFLAAGALAGPVSVVNFPEPGLQGDRAFVDLLEKMGAKVERKGARVSVRAPERRLAALDVDMGATPDLVPTLAALALFARGVTHIRNVAHLRVKETDRLEALSRELTRGCGNGAGLHAHLSA